MSLIDPREAKRVLRALLRPTRSRGDDALLATRILALGLPSGCIVAGVWPLPGEPDLIAVWDELHARGHRIVLPETTPRGEKLVFRPWTPASVMQPGRYGTMHPTTLHTFPDVTPDVVFVPLLAWDRRMARLGYGGGYYDRTLARLPDALAVGFGFSAQELAEVPVGPYDVLLDAVVTEHGVVTAEGQSFEDLVSGRHRRTQRT